MPRLTIQPSIQDLRSRALLDLIERLGAIDLTTLLVYRLDSTPVDVLPLLAWQFDILEPQWQLGASNTESIDNLQNIDTLTNVDSLTSSGGVAGTMDSDSWRQLPKAAIPLHRNRGTPYAIRSALASLGWTSVKILEGQNSWSGTTYPASQGWAVFRVVISVAAGQGVQSEDVERICNAIKFYKPIRAWLDSIWFTLPALREGKLSITDSVVSIFSQHDSARPPVDVVSGRAWIASDTKGITPTHDGHFYYTGISYGPTEPIVADSGATVLGQAIAAK